MLIFSIALIITLIIWGLWTFRMSKQYSEAYSEPDTVPSKPDKIIENDIVPFKTEAIILGTFYDRDKKFASICPLIGNKIIGIPHVVLVGDDEQLKWGIGEISKDVKEKAANIYKQYKSENKDKFQ